ncbi:MAG: hypothetical protein ACPG8W_09655 [Candidatus Promineifilaceae bacterium]
MSTFSRYVCWGNTNNLPISKVINKEAVSVERAVFLATHVPFEQIRYLKPEEHKDTSETGLVRDLLKRRAEDRHSFTVIQGMSGTGKSHLIRWLKERYLMEIDERKEAVLLIERANSSLRQTLLQIVQSKMFDATKFAEQIRRIENATQQLSDESLADTILNNLQVAAREVKVEIQHPQESRLRKRVEPNIGSFLLNPSVRDVLKRKGGAVDRLREFLSGKGDTGLGGREHPQFSAEDLEFDMSVLDEIRRRGYREEKRLADALKLKKEVMPGYVASYLNELLPFAIQRTTALSSDDLKELFLELRRELKQQGKNLTLFIEDISVFTGLDAGLVDVLVTQHTGEGGTAFCRMTSVVGITDAYYRDKFPDNIKGRVDFRLTLNSDVSKQAELLSSPEKAADLFSKYLNVLRLDTQTFEKWVQDDNAHPESLPNACTVCPHQTACHRAFGTRSLDNNEAERQSGLYPFNQNAIKSMFEGLRSQIDKTPRTVLEILETSLNYDDDIRMGNFPAPARNLFSYVNAPILRTGSDRLIRSQAPQEAERMEALFAFWGDRTASRQVTDRNEAYVSGLSEGVFTAFDLPFIEGVKGKTPPKEKIPVTNRGGIRPKPVKPNNRKKTPDAKPVERESPIIVDISKWRRGEQLSKPADIRGWLSKFLIDAIEWETHHLPLNLVKDRLKAGTRIYIEGQRSRHQGDRITFQRSPEMADVFEALAHLNNKTGYTLSAIDYGTHFVTLNTWLEKEKARVVHFVSQPYGETTAPCSLSHLIIQNNLLLTCLSEDLLPSQKSTKHLTQSIIRNSFTDFETLRNRLPYPHTRAWHDLAKSVSRFTVKNSQENNARLDFRQIINRPQGSSSSVLFIDAALVWDTVRQLKQNQWAFGYVRVEGSVSNSYWDVALRCHEALHEFNTVIDREWTHVQQIHTKITTLLGDVTPHETFEAMAAMLQTFDSQSIYTGSFKRDETFTARKLTSRLRRLNEIVNKEQRNDQILQLSGSGETLQHIQQYISYLNNFLKLIDLQTEKANARLRELTEEANRSDDFQPIVHEYNSLLSMLDLIKEGTQ